MRKRRDGRVLMAIVAFLISFISLTLQAWILSLYIDAIIFNNWDFFSKTFSVSPPASGPNVYCLDRCVAELPFISGWIGIASFLLGWMVLVYSWWKPKLAD